MPSKMFSTLVAAGLAIGAMLLADAGSEPVRAEAPASVAAEAPTAEQVDRLFEALRLSATIAGWREVFGTYDPAMCDCPDDPDLLARQEDAWGKAVDAAFKNDDILNAMRQAYRTQLTATDVGALIADEESALGQKIAAANAAPPPASDAEYQAQIDEGLAMLEAKPHRKAVLEKIVERSGGADSMVTLIEKLVLGMVLGVNMAQPEGAPQVDPKDLAESIRADMQDARAEVMRSALASLAVAYRGFSMDELEAYAALMASPVQQKSVRVFLDAFNAKMSVVALETGRVFAEELQKLDL